MVGRIQQTLAASIPEIVNFGDYFAEATRQVATVVAICVGAWVAYRVIWCGLKWSMLLVGGPIVAFGLWWKGKD